MCIILVGERLLSNNHSGMVVLSELFHCSRVVVLVAVLSALLQEGTGKGDAQAVNNLWQDIIQVGINMKLLQRSYNQSIYQLRKNILKKVRCLKKRLMSKKE